MSVRMTNEPSNYLDGDNPLYANPNGTGPITTLLLYDIPSYTTYDAAVGVSQGQLDGAAHGHEPRRTRTGPSNMTSGQFIKAEMPLRPRVRDAADGLSSSERARCMPAALRAGCSSNRGRTFRVRPLF